MTARLVVLAGVLQACAHGGSGASGSGATASADPAAIVGRRLDVTVTSSTYEPAELQAKTGEDLTVVFTRTSKGECGAEVVFEDLGIRKYLPVGEPVLIPLHPDKAGPIAFRCGMRMMKGVIQVTD
ncbi:MAG: cupredoxin domain-containing protein [Deltaproteobacteria bacterium]|nr:cupredoxin domain-containing protein [Deltaproteobacteria bacterium]